MSAEQPPTAVKHVDAVFADGQRGEFAGKHSGGREDRREERTNADGGSNGRKKEVYDERVDET